MEVVPACLFDSSQPLFDIKPTQIAWLLTRLFGLRRVVICVSPGALPRIRKFNALAMLFKYNACYLAVI